MKKTINLLLLLLAVNSLNAQNTYSVYSTMGVGDIHKQGFGQTRSMGGASAALNTFNQLNISNSASLTNLDTNSFLLDVGIAGNSATFQSNSGHNSFNDFSLNNLAFAFPVLKGWSFAAGMTPYSRVGYFVKQTENTLGFNVDHYYQGSGGINKIFIANGFKPFPFLSFGFDFSYYFGYINHTQLTDLPDDAYASEAYNRKQINMNDFRISPSILIELPINKNLNLNIGGRFDNKTKMNSKFNELTRQNFYVGSTLYGDTLKFIEEKADVELPLAFNSGISINYKQNFIFALDYFQEQWGSINSVFGQSLSDCYGLNSGVEFTPNPKAVKGYLNRVKYRTGVYYISTGINVNATDIVDQGFTIGLGLPLRYSNTTFNITYENGVRGTVANNLVKENYQHFLINFTFYDIWFIKPKYR